MADYVDLTKFITERLVNEPAAVEVQLVPRGRTTIVEIKVADSDIGKIIGKGGRNIDAIRAVVRAAGLRNHERVQVEIAEDDEHREAHESAHEGSADDFAADDFGSEESATTEAAAATGFNGEAGASADV